MNNKRILFMNQAAMIAAIYVVLTVVFAPFSFREIQVRVSEALVILPYFTSAAIPGLAIGCLIGNIIGGAILPDIIWGSIATLIGAVGTYYLSKVNKHLAPIPPILSNAIIIPLVLKLAYGVPLPIPVLILSVAVGEIISAGLLGMIVMKALGKHKHKIFKK